MYGKLNVIFMTLSPFNLVIMIDFFHNRNYLWKEKSICWCEYMHFIFLQCFQCTHLHNAVSVPLKLYSINCAVSQKLQVIVQRYFMSLCMRHWSLKTCRKKQGRTNLIFESQWTQLCHPDWLPITDNKQLNSMETLVIIISVQLNATGRKKVWLVKSPINPDIVWSLAVIFRSVIVMWSQTVVNFRFEHEYKIE